MSDVFDGTSAAPAHGPRRRTFLAAAGAGALTVAGAGTAARAATGRAPVRVATVVLNGRVFTEANGSTRAQAVRRVPRSQSLVMHTAGAAHQLHYGNSGTVSPGRRADLIVLDRDLTKVPVKGIRSTKVQYTLISGRVVHEAGSETGRARAEAARRMGTLGAGRTSGGSCCQGH